MIFLLNWVIFGILVRKKAISVGLHSWCFKLVVCLPGLRLVGHQCCGWLFVSCLKSIQQRMFSLQRPSVSRCYFHLCPFLDWRLPYRVEISSECPQAPVVVFACLPCHPGLFLLPPLVLQGKDIDCRGLSLSQCPSNEYLGSKIGQQVQRNGATKILTILTLDSFGHEDCSCDPCRTSRSQNPPPRRWQTQTCWAVLALSASSHFCLTRWLDAIRLVGSFLIRSMACEQFRNGHVSAHGEATMGNLCTLRNWLNPTGKNAPNSLLVEGRVWLQLAFASSLCLFLVRFCCIFLLEVKLPRCIAAQLLLYHQKNAGNR